MVNITKRLLNLITQDIYDNYLNYLSVGAGKTAIQNDTDDITSPFDMDATNRNKAGTGSGSVSENFFSKEFKIVATEPVDLSLKMQEFAIVDTLGTKNSTVDNCDATTGFTGTGATTTTGTGSNFISTSAALIINKTGTGQPEFGVYKTVTSLNATGKRLVLGFRSENDTKLDSTNAITIKYGSDSTNYYSKTYSRSDITDNKNRNNYFVFSNEVGTGDMSLVGSPTIAAMDYFEIVIKTNNATDVSSDEFGIDDIKLVTSETDSVHIGYIHPVPITKDNLGEHTIRITGSVTEGI